MAKNLPEGPSEEAIKKPRKKPVRKRPKLDIANPIDVHVGQRVRMRRTLLGLTQNTLAERVGITFQQVQKYERGSNRMTASRLWELSSILDVPIAYFYEDISTATKDAAARIANVGATLGEGFSESPAEPFEVDPANKRQSLELVRAYLKIKAPSVRKRLFDLTKALGAIEGSDGATEPDDA